VDIDWTFCGEAYEVDPKQAVVQALRSAHRIVTGEQMALTVLNYLRGTDQA